MLSALEPGHNPSKVYATLQVSNVHACANTLGNIKRLKGPLPAGTLNQDYDEEEEEMLDLAYAQHGSTPILSMLSS